MSQVTIVIHAPATLLKKRLWHRCSPVNFAKFLRTRFSQNTSGRLLPEIFYNHCYMLSWIYFLYFRHKLINKCQDRQCIAHYSNSNRTYSKLKTLSESRLNRPLEAKSLREKETLEANIYSALCATISTKDDFDCSVHGIHLDPCYKSFTKILCPFKKRKLQDTFSQGVQRTKRQKRSSSTACLLSTTCFKCHVGRRKRKSKIEVPHKVILQSAAVQLLS